MVCRCTGRVYIDNFRPGFSSFHVRTALHRAAGLSESAADSVPFRLTRNIERILQPFLLNSIMKSTVGALLLAMRTTSESGGLLEPYVTLFLLDEMKQSKQQDPCTSVAGEKQLIMNRLITTAPKLHLSDGVCIEAGLNRLIQLAQSPDCIALMEAHWEPWL
jgi:phosphatidylinositol kinase/protein kinase (PI-3  family)